MIIGSATANIDDNLKLANDAQDAADKAGNGVSDINTDNKLTPSEKINLKRVYDSDVLKYQFDVKQLQVIPLPTTDIDKAMHDLTDFVNHFFTNMDITETVDRNALNTVFNNFDTADKNVEGLFNESVQKVADAAKQAGDDARQAGEDAKASADQASKDAKTALDQAQAAQDRAQSSIDQLNVATKKYDTDIANAQKEATDALNNVKVVDSKVANLSNSTTAQFNTLNSGYQLTLKTLNDMSIGGRNLVLNSADMSTFRVWKQDGTSTVSDDKKEVTVTTSHGGINIERKQLSNNLPNVGDTIVISAEIKGTSHIQFNFNDGESFKVAGSNIPASAEYKRYSTTFIWKPVNIDKVSFVVYANGATNQNLSIKKVKIEIGNKATDWSPAPEDMATQTQITTINGLINQKVSSSQYNTDKTQTDKLISQTVSKIDSLSVGGTNLLKNSELVDGLANWRIWGGAGTREIVDVKDLPGISKGFHFVKSDENQMGYAQDGIVVVGGTYFTGSFYYKSTNALDKSITIQFATGGSGQGPWVNGVVDKPVNDGKWHRFTYTEKIPEGISLASFYVGMQYVATGDIVLAGFKFEIGNKATDWSLSPLDTATSTQFNQVYNDIQLKANSKDVASQIDVAVKGIQATVTNNTNKLQSQISQTANTVQILNTTSGTKNLVYNSGFKNLTSGFPDGWTASADGTNPHSGYFSSHQQSAYQGTGSIGVNTTNTAWVMFAQSKPMPLAVDNNTDPNLNVYSASMMVKNYPDGDKPNGRVHVVLAFFDANQKRLENDIKGVWSRQANETKGAWELVKVEGLTPLANAKYVAIQAFTYGNPTHAMINQPMINVGTTVVPYRPDEVNQSDITSSIDNIHLGVKNVDGSSSTFNMNSNIILLDTSKIILNGNTSIQNGTIGTAKIADAAINNAKIANASIDDVKINNLNGNKIIAGSITAKQLNANDIIANVINGKTINGITINTPNLNLGDNGVLNTTWALNESTGLFAAKKGNGTTELKAGQFAFKGANMQRWWSADGGYWYGMSDDGLTKVKNGTNTTGDRYGAGYEQHNIFNAQGNTIMRSYLDAEGLYFTSGGTTTYDTAINREGIKTNNGEFFQNLLVDGSFRVTGHPLLGVAAGTGFDIYARSILVQNADDIFFNNDKGSGVTIHAKSLSQASTLSSKKNITKLDQERAIETIRNADIYEYNYLGETDSYKKSYSVVIDDINNTPQYQTPEEFITNDRSGRNDGNAVGFLIESVKYLDNKVKKLEEQLNEQGQQTA